MFNNPYIPNVYNSQPSVDRINSQIAELENMKKQIQQPIQQPTNLTQNFQLAPNNNNATIRYANSMDEVERNVVISDTPFFSNDLSIVWIKNTKGEIKTYELNEIIQKDEKDMKIELLQQQLNEMKGLIENAKSNGDDVSESTKSKKSTSISDGKSSNAK